MDFSGSSPPKTSKKCWDLLPVPSLELARSVFSVPFSRWRRRSSSSSSCCRSWEAWRWSKMTGETGGKALPMDWFKGKSWDFPWIFPWHTGVSSRLSLTTIHWPKIQTVENIFSWEKNSPWLRISCCLGKKNASQLLGILFSRWKEKRHLWPSGWKKVIGDEIRVSCINIKAQNIWVSNFLTNHTSGHVKETWGESHKTTN